MSFKIAFIGAGSVGFTRRLISDILTVKELRDIEIALMDIDRDNLDRVRQLIEKDLKGNGCDKVKLSTTLDRTEALKDAKYILNVVRIGGLEAFEKDISIPLEYGVDQCVGDTLGPGGIMYGQRGISFMLGLCKDIKEFACPDALLLNYANPNAMMTWAAQVYGGVKTLGLCHGVQHGAHLIADALKIPFEEIDYSCVGINHQTWYTDYRHNGKSIPQSEILAALEADEKIRDDEKCRIDMMKRFGYFSTESNGHLSEYLPWYRKRPEELGKWISTSSWIQGETAGYLRVNLEDKAWFKEDFPKWLAEDHFKYDDEHRSEEHGSYIIEGLETGRIYRGHFNLPNEHAITNLPEDAVVEVPCYVDRNGIHVPQHGDLPDGCAAVCSTSISVQRLATRAAVEGNIDLLRQAMMMDPLTGAVCNPPEIWQMTDEMLIALAEWMPQYAEEVERARARIVESKKDGSYIPTNKGYLGAVRLDVKNVDQLRETGKKIFTDENISTQSE